MYKANSENPDETGAVSAGFTLFSNVCPILPDVLNYLALRKCIFSCNTDTPVKQTKSMFNLNSVNGSLRKRPNELTF